MVMDFTNDLTERGFRLDSGYDDAQTGKYRLTRKGDRKSYRPEMTVIIAPREDGFTVAYSGRDTTGVYDEFRLSLIWPKDAVNDRQLYLGRFDAEGKPLDKDAEAILAIVEGRHLASLSFLIENPENPDVSYRYNVMEKGEENNIERIAYDNERFKD